MGHLLEGQVAPGVINLLRSAHTRSASGLPQAAISWTSRRRAPQVRAGPSAGWPGGAGRDKRRATRRSKETGRWAAAGLQRQRAPPAPGRAL